MLLDPEQNFFCPTKLDFGAYVACVEQLHTCQVDKADDLCKQNKSSSKNSQTKQSSPREEKKNWTIESQVFL